MNCRSRGSVPSDTKVSESFVTGIITDRVRSFWEFGFHACLVHGELQTCLSASAARTRCPLKVIANSKLCFEAFDLYNLGPIIYLMYTVQFCKQMLDLCEGVGSIKHGRVDIKGSTSRIRDPLLSKEIALVFVLPRGTNLAGPPCSLVVSPAEPSLESFHHSNILFTLKIWVNVPRLVFLLYIFLFSVKECVGKHNDDGFVDVLEFTALYRGSECHTSYHFSLVL